MDNNNITGVAPTPSADLDCFDTRTLSEEGVEMELKALKTGRGSGAYIKLLGMDSERFMSIVDERAREITERASRSITTDYTPTERMERTADLCARCTIGWRGLAKGGVDITHSVQAARQLYLDYPAIRDQVNEFIGERSNFIKA